MRPPEPSHLWFSRLPTAVQPDDAATWWSSPPSLATIRSIYRWEGAVQDDPEARVALHTRASLVPAIVQRADRDHPYDVPCVIAFPITAGNPAYLQWIGNETRATG